ncbi:hypothetical protein NK718_13535 [Alsobacter sp. SYSU M60028]|uniref:EscE/YscE/SsaE family type III secretion system needle protein co-chaperone n=1 Tax=Alsobacter ponti TaxID=2962936 RepID=A0ABT1LH25_9HYPH|nr:hypothetical protein [Alsobacter ponti]MCP8939543.1 hypothetical protein [Alsobacter ponti]
MIPPVDYEPLTELEAALAGPDGQRARAESLARLGEALARHERLLAIGLPRADFEAAQAIVKGLLAARETLRNVR